MLNVYNTCIYMYMYVCMCVYIHVHVYVVVMVIQVVGKIGTVVGISESGDLRIRYPENLIYILCPEAVVKVGGSTD